MDGRGIALDERQASSWGILEYRPEKQDANILYEISQGTVG
jgi:hypothetical protein